MLLDEEMVETLRDETGRAVLREVRRLRERERKIVSGIGRQFEEQQERLTAVSAASRTSCSLRVAPRAVRIYQDMRSHAEMARKRKKAGSL
jgi:hypothetical protein